MTLLEASLLHERASDAVAYSKMFDPTVVKRTALEPMNSALLKRETASPPERSSNAAECLQEMVVALAKLSDVDRMLQHVQRTVPAEDAAAQKWHQISLTSLQWTRKAKSEHFQTKLKELKSVMLALSGPAKEWAAKPAVRVEDTALISKTSDEIIRDDSQACADAPNVVGKHRFHDLEKVGSLRNDLETLRKRDPDCCLIVRNIKRLGLESAESLRAHFSHFAELTEVYCAHSFEKPNAKRRNGRVRPAALGFVVMASSEGAKKVLAAGNEQSVGDVRVRVGPMGPFVEGQPTQTEQD